MKPIDSLVAAIEGDLSKMSHADLVLTCNMLTRGREAWRKDFEELKARTEQGSCFLAGPGRGDCEHFVGLPGLLIKGNHDDVYGKPNGWCWFCWWSYRTHKAEAKLTTLRADKAELVEALQDLMRDNKELGAISRPSGNAARALITKHTKP